MRACMHPPPHSRHTTTTTHHHQPLNPPPQKKTALEYNGQQRDAYPYSVPEVLFFNTWPGYSAKNFLRKTSSDFGWDWGPAFIPQGIIRDVVLFKSAIGELSDVLVQQTPQAGGAVLVAATAVVQHVPAKGEAWLSLELEGSGAPAVVNKRVMLAAGENAVRALRWLLRCVRACVLCGPTPRISSSTPLLLLSSSSSSCALDSHPHTHAFTSPPKKKQITETFLIKDPQLWWPVGMGKPHLYKLRAKLSHVKVDEGQVKVSQSPGAAGWLHAWLCACHAAFVLCVCVCVCMCVCVWRGLYPRSCLSVHVCVYIGSIDASIHHRTTYTHTHPKNHHHHQQQQHQQQPFPPPKKKQNRPRTWASAPCTWWRSRSPGRTASPSTLR